MGGAFRVARNGEEGPGRRRGLGQPRGGALWQAGMAQQPRGGAGEGRKRRTGAVEHGQRDHCRHFPPALPAVQGGKGIRSHDPHAPSLPQQRVQHLQQVEGVADAQLPLDVEHAKARMTGQRLRLLKALCVVGIDVGGLQRIVPGQQPPHLVQPQALDGLLGNVPVARMRRVEGAAHQADAPPPQPGCGQQGGDGRMLWHERPGWHGLLARFVIVCGMR